MSTEKKYTNQSSMNSHCGRTLVQGSVKIVVGLSRNIWVVNLFRNEDC